MRFDSAAFRSDNKGNVMGFFGRVGELTYEYEFIIKHEFSEEWTPFTFHQKGVTAHSDEERQGLISFLNRINELPDVEVELYELHGRERII